MKKIIFHIDVNSAYLSWTAIKLLRDGSETDLRKIPAIVGGDMSKRHGVVLAKSTGALAGVEPEVMGLGPIAATKKVMAKTGLSVADMDLIEANEAFAAQSVAVSQALDFDMNKVNVNGGAIALGHPVGASGARILVTLLYAMKHRGAHKGLATLCIGGGMGCATIVEMD